mgnify:CR=1 FL=1
MLTTEFRRFASIWTFAPETRLKNENYLEWWWWPARKICSNLKRWQYEFSRQKYIMMNLHPYVMKYLIHLKILTIIEWILQYSTKVPTTTILSLVWLTSKLTHGQKEFFCWFENCCNFELSFRLEVAWKSFNLCAK